MKNRNTLGSLLLVLTALIWGTAFAFQRVGMEHIGPFTFNAVRMLLAAAAALGAGLASAKSRPAASGALRATLPGGVCCGLFLAAASSFQQLGIVTTTAGKAGFITAMYILIVPVLEALLFRRRSPRRVWLAVALGVAGMYLLCVTGDLTLTRGDALVAVGSLLFAGHILCCDRFSRRADPLFLSAIQFFTVSVLCAILACSLETVSLSALRAAAVPILYCGLISGGVGYTLQMVAQRWTEPTVASLLMSLEAVFAALAGALLLHERLTPRELLGCLVMFAAILLVQLPVRRG